jgi:hypothetical protein
MASTISALAGPRRERFMSRKFLYRRLRLAVIVILPFFAVTAPSGMAQGGRPQLKRPENAPEEKPPEPKKKKVKGPRAVAVLQLNSSGKGTLVPIAILVDGRFHDASVYKADPVPMALDSGTVYEVEQGGDSQGLFTVSGALHSTTEGRANPWVGAGSYLPNGTEAAKATRKAEDVPLGLDNGDSDGPPRLTRGKASTAAPAKPSSGPASGTPAGAGASEKPAPAAPPASAPPAGGSTTGATTGQDGAKPAPPAASDKPADPSAKGQAPAGQPSQGEASQSQQQGKAAENYYRPTLRRGKPTQPAPQDEEAAPKTGKADSAAAASVAGAGPAPVQLVPAISDAGGPDPKSYRYFWKTGEEEEQRQRMMALAEDEVRAYANALVKNRIPAKPPVAKPAASGRKPAVKGVPPVLENTTFRAFDVWGNNQPVMILTADAHFPPAPGADAAPEQFSITLVSRTDIYGYPRKLYTGVTDRFHLDVTARLELIDVVDADGDGRGELLFRETTDAGSGYVIYRATPDKLWKMFDSLAAE